MTYFRIDRPLTLYLFYLLLRRNRRRTKQQVPILMYHSIASGRMQGGHPYFETSTHPSVFSNHMKFLHDNGYSNLSLQDLILHQSADKRLERKSVVITFDDGFRDFLSEAFGVLDQYDYSATVFLPTGFMQKEGNMRLKSKEYLSWSEISKLSQNGIDFGSHSVNHLDLYALRKSEIEFEIRESKEAIEKEIGTSIRSFSYPYAFPAQDMAFKKYLRDTLEKYGFNCCATTNIGTTSLTEKSFFLKRLPVNTFDDSKLLAAKLAGGYDWLYYLQYLFKLLKNRGTPLKESKTT